MTKILYANMIGDVSGAENSLLSLMKGLEGTEFEPVLACSTPGVLTEMAEKQGIPVRVTFVCKSSFAASPWVLLRQLLRLVSQVRQLLRVLHEERIGLVHVNTYKIGLPYTLAGKLKGIPVVWHIRDFLAKTGFERRILEILFRYLPNQVIAVSDACAAQFDAGWEGKLCRIYNGIDARAFRAQARRDLVRNEFGIDAKTPLVGSVGQLIAWKGQDVFLRAMARVSEASPEARFMVVGDEVVDDEPFRDHLESLVLELGLESATAFTGFRRDVASLMDAMDIFVHCPIRPDPFPRVLLEAMALGKAIVATETGGMPEMVTHGESGVLVPPGNPEGLADAVITVLADPALAARLGAAGREKVNAFTVTRHVQQVSDLYRELLESKEVM